MNRWRMISVAFFVPVFAYGVLQAMGTHEHAEPPPNYDYLKRATRVRFFPLQKFLLDCIARI